MTRRGPRSFDLFFGVMLAAAALITALGIRDLSHPAPDTAYLITLRVSDLSFAAADALAAEESLTLFKNQTAVPVEPPRRVPSQRIVTGRDGALILLESGERVDLYFTVRAEGAEDAQGRRIGGTHFVAPNMTLTLSAGNVRADAKILSVEKADA